MIRPSALQMAERCTESAYLSAEHPEDNEYARKGRAVHEGIHACWNKLGWSDGGDTQLRDMVVSGIRVLIGLKDAGHTIRTEAPLELLDDDGTVLTRGTADVVADNGEEFIVLDWKTGRSENVESPDENLQLAAYALASHADRWGLVFLAESEEIHWSQPIGPSARAKWMDRIRAIQKDQRAATPGDHCSKCYVRHHCATYRGLVSTAMSLLPNSPKDIVLNDETVSALAARAKIVEKALKIADDLVDQYVARGGRVIVGDKQLGIIEKAGRETADLAALRRDGLNQYIRAGKPYPSRVWRNVKEG